jgi:hypothetical protein
MSRQDIADYLGLTIETVSRTLTHLEKTATIELPSSRRILLRNRSALNRLNALGTGKGATRRRAKPAGRCDDGCAEAARRPPCSSRLRRGPA